jgi:hypothetical protein
MKLVSILNLSILEKSRFLTSGVLCGAEIKMVSEEISNERLARKLRAENLERCLNCSHFADCSENMVDIVVCERFDELKVDDQVIIVGLVDYSRLKDSKDILS